jgi:hypothetical protein
VSESVSLLWPHGQLESGKEGWSFAWHSLIEVTLRMVTCSLTPDLRSDSRRKSLFRGNFSFQGALGDV